MGRTEAGKEFGRRRGGEGEGVTENRKKCEKT